jgi:hypothetical protein
VHFRQILSGYFLFPRFDWSIFVTQLVAKHMKEIIKKRIEIEVHTRTYLIFFKNNSIWSLLFLCGKDLSSNLAKFLSIHPQQTSYLKTNTVAFDVYNLNKFSEHQLCLIPCRLDVMKVAESVSLEVLNKSSGTDECKYDS